MPYLFDCLAMVPESLSFKEIAVCCAILFVILAVAVFATDSLE